MTANTTPIFTLTPVLALAALGTANTARDGSGTVVDIVTGAANGTRISKITLQATVTTTAGMVRLFLYDGATTLLWREILVTAITGSATVQEWSWEILLYGEAALVLPSGAKLIGSVEKSEAINVIAEGGSY